MKPEERTWILCGASVTPENKLSRQEFKSFNGN